MVRDALVAATANFGFNIYYEENISVWTVFWVEIPPLYKIYCTYSVSYYLEMSCASRAPKNNVNELDSKLKISLISAATNKNIFWDFKLERNQYWQIRDIPRFKKKGLAFIKIIFQPVIKNINSTPAFWLPDQWIKFNLNVWENERDLWELKW